MVKRRQRPADTDEDDYEDGGSDESYAAPVKSSRKQATTARRKTGAKVSVGQDKELEEATDDALPRHAVSTHVISTAVPIREALLTWYAGVHESRGMPWRKPYDEKLGPDERAQRAYEVR